MNIKSQSFYRSRVTAIVMMLSMGGGSLTSIALGKSNNDKANNIFRLIFLTIVIFSVIISVICLLFTEQVARFLGASEGLLEISKTYIFYFVVNTACILLAPLLFGKDFIFLGIIIAEFIVLIVTLLLFKNDKVTTLKH